MKGAWRFKKRGVVGELEHEIGILKMQVAGLKKELADCDAFVTVLNAENEYLKADGGNECPNCHGLYGLHSGMDTCPPEAAGGGGYLPTWDGPNSP